MPQNIIVTGSNGLLGQKLTDLLAGDPDLYLVATGVGPNRHPGREGYTYEEMDIRDEDRVRQLLEAFRPTHLVNGAAMTHVDKCENERDRCWELNVTAVGMLARLCKEYDVQLVHISTDFIFDGENGPYAEDDLPNPVSHYGNSKLASEKLVISSGVRFAIARTMLVYGLVADMSRSNIVLWAKGALERGEEIRVVNDQFRSPTLAEDLANGVVRIVRGNHEGIFHLSGPETVSIVEMVRKVAQHYGLPLHLIQETNSESLGQAARRPPVTGFVIDKAVEELGYRPHTISQGLQVLDEQLALFQSGNG